MNSMVFCLSLVIVSTFMLSEVESYSPMRCGQCNRRLCPSAYNCRCGSYQDSCGCCSICYKCPGQKCSFVANEQCAGGKRCQQPMGATGFNINMDGQCL